MTKLNWKRQERRQHPAGEEGQHWSTWLDDDKLFPGPTESISIKAHYHYNGSGPTAFGGAKKWPVAQLEVSFKQGEEAKRDAFIVALQEFIEACKENS